MSRPGASAQLEFEKRHRRREEEIHAKWGRLAGVVKFLSEDPQSTKAWEKGSEGERRLAAYLRAAVGDRSIMLHDRQIPGTRANIDHLVVAASGVWVVDAKTYRGKVEQRDVGGWLKTDYRLYVGGRDRSKLADGLVKQIVAVLAAINGVDAEVPIEASLCFVDSEWSLFAKPFHQGGVLVTSPKMLAKAIAGPGALDREQVFVIASKLEAGLPAAAAPRSQPQ
jgi:Nuclease-related domain